MSTLVSYGHLKINLVSIYAPNTSHERKPFFQNLHEFFFTGFELINGGDFNCIDSQKDKYSGNFDTGFVVKQKLSKLKSDFYLTDIWRKKNPRIIQFTWMNANATIACRLDKFLISKNLMQSTRSCEIKPCHYSDHDFVHLSIDTHSFCNRRPGVWRLNTSVLSDPEYVNLIETLFDSYPRPSTGIPFLNITVQLIQAKERVIN